MINKNRLSNIYNTVEKYLLNINKIQKFPLTNIEIMNNVQLGVRGIYVIYDKGIPMYVGQAGGSININNESDKRLRQRLLQYTHKPNEDNKATQNVRNYLEDKPITMSDLEFSYLVISDIDLIIIAEQIAISILNNGYKNNLINK